MQGLAQKTDKRSAFLFTHNVVRPQQAVRLAGDGSDGESEGEGEGAGAGAGVGNSPGNSSGNTPGHAANGRHTAGGGSGGNAHAHAHTHQNSPASGGRVVVEEVWNSERKRRRAAVKSIKSISAFKLT